MDAESLKSLGWMLLWGGVFFLMMRYGCGAHMMGGHGHAGHGRKSGEDQKDPVCGMIIDGRKAAAASVLEGQTYYFCSTSCRDKFELNPEKYPAASGRNPTRQGGHHHG